jgi:hypothetical protein
MLRRDIDAEEMVMGDGVRSLIPVLMYLEMGWADHGSEDYRNLSRNSVVVAY